MADFGDDLFDVFDEEILPTTVKKEIKEETVISSPLASRLESTALSSPSVKREHSDDESDTIKKRKPETVFDEINVQNISHRIKVHTVETLEACLHEVAVPPDEEYVPLRVVTTKPAKEYPFILDPFQKEAIACVDNDRSVLVSAHTSAGKTVVAEYAIARSLKDKQRVIYTTPIKALSNQKYREFYEEFHDVGLVTGDVTINPTASCLIMTTEILRNMLYRGSEVMREVGWVIFDEIHYMRDKERGVVWEETLILLPDNVHYVFLSATIPNARQFCEWVCHLHHQPCHVVYTDYRPVPLQHFLFPAGGEGIHLIVDEKGNFKEDNFNQAMAVLANAGELAKGDKQLRGRKGGSKTGGDTNCFKIVKMIMERNFAPVIIFSFSKKDCELYAMQMAKLDFNTLEEKKLVDEVFNNAMDVLSEQDRTLPQVENVKPLLRRGIGIHHGGLLPILKETIEILFAEGLIKALFATETFAMGLNMPARTVLFTGARKFDGKDFRFVTSGEYIQMSGRAGRRGLDDKGIVILMIDEKVSPQEGREIIQGKADPINSAFHLTYNMVLNLLRVEEINPEYMLERSFFQFQNQAAIPQLHQKMQEQQQLHDSVVIPNENEIASYHHIRERLNDLSKQFQEYLTRPQFLIPFLQPGRLVKVKAETEEAEEFEWGVVVNFEKKGADERGKNPAKESAMLYVHTLLYVRSSGGTDDTGDAPQPCPLSSPGEIEVVPVKHSQICQISSLRVHVPDDLTSPDKKKSVLKTIEQVVKRFPDGVPLLDPQTDMKIKDHAFTNIVALINTYEKRLFDHPMHENDSFEDVYERYLEKVKVGKELKESKAELKKAMSLLQMEELKCRKRVLRRMGYCTADDVIEMKGRVACELSSGEELLMTELIFNGVFNDLTVPQCVALLSTFVCDEKSSENPRMSEELAGPLRQMQELARRIARVSVEAKITMDEDTYVEQFKPFLMDVCYSWCNGASFLEICKMTDIFEGSIIRCMRRLEEMLRQLVQASKNIGNTDLENKFSEAIKLMKRDIVFAASLYL
uniref:Helicase ATP-binding domain-containing protein n=1 Tax=Graphocephala atropunctata TaxID=36148 RepID=A0A1B6MD42_9HEMI